MFEDLIDEEKTDPHGCWNCMHSTTAFISLFCQKYKKYRTSFDGTGCKDFEERIIKTGVHSTI